MIVNLNMYNMLLISDQDKIRMSQKTNVQQKKNNTEEKEEAEARKEELMSLREKVTQRDAMILEVRQEEENIRKENKELKKTNKELEGKNLVMNAKNALLDASLLCENLTVKALKEEVESWVLCVEKVEASAQEKARLYEEARAAIEKNWENSKKEEKKTEAICGTGTELDDWVNTNLYSLEKRRKRNGEGVIEDSEKQIQDVMGRIVGMVEAKVAEAKEEEDGVFCITSEMTLKQVKKGGKVNYEIIDCNVHPKKVKNYQKEDKKQEIPVEDHEGSSKEEKQKKIELRLAEIRKGHMDM